MTKDQDQHVHDLSEEFTIIMSAKYRAGQLEHKGNLWEKSDQFLLNAAIDEAIDQVVYLLTLRKKLYG